MDQMCMSMVKLQGRLQFSQARAGVDAWFVDGGWVEVWRRKGGGSVFHDVDVVCFGWFQEVVVEV